MQVQVISALAVFERIFEYLDMPTEEVACAGAQPLERTKGRIDFEDVGFSYGDRPALRGITLHIEPGQTRGARRPVGCG